MKVGFKFLLHERSACSSTFLIEKRLELGKSTVACVLMGFTMLAIWTGKDTTSLGILATAGVGILPIMYRIYERGSTKEKLKHMEKNYNPNYDDEEGIY